VSADPQVTAARALPLASAAAGEALLRSRLAFSPDEAATILGVGRDTVYDLLRTGQLKSRKAGARRIIGRKQLEDYLAGGDDAA
jgi:excisionase family DNA binding protein